MYTKQLQWAFPPSGSAANQQANDGPAPAPAPASSRLLVNAPTVVVVEAVISVHLLGTASSIPHLWRAPKEGKRKTSYWKVLKHFYRKRIKATKMFQTVLTFFSEKSSEFQTKKKNIRILESRSKLETWLVMWLKSSFTLLVKDLRLLPLEGVTEWTDEQTKMENGKQVALLTYLQPLGTTGSLDRLGRVLANADVSGVRIVEGKEFGAWWERWMDGWMIGEVEGRGGQRGGE